MVIIYEIDIWPENKFLNKFFEKTEFASVQCYDFQDFIDFKKLKTQKPVWLVS